MLAVSGKHERLKLWQFDSDSCSSSAIRLVLDHRCHDTWISLVRFYYHGDESAVPSTSATLATASVDGSIKVWRLESIGSVEQPAYQLVLVRQLSEPDYQPVTALCWHGVRHLHPMRELALSTRYHKLTSVRRSRAIESPSARELSWYCIRSIRTTRWPRAPRPCTRT